MDAVRKDVRRLVNKELEAANKRFPQFASPHEGQNVVREELEEAERAIVPLKLYIETRMWNMVKANQTVPKDDFKAIREAAVNLAVEAIQVAVCRHCAVKPAVGAAAKPDRVDHVACLSGPPKPISILYRKPVVKLPP